MLEVKVKKKINLSNAQAERCTVAAGLQMPRSKSVELADKSVELY